MRQGAGKHLIWFVGCIGGRASPAGEFIRRDEIIVLLKVMDTQNHYHWSFVKLGNKLPTCTGTQPTKLESGYMSQ